jgi:hypothetical protein
MASELPSSKRRHGGDRHLAQARAERAAQQPSLLIEISEYRQQLDQDFYDHLRRLRVCMAMPKSIKL